jgi:hypothetical protein
MKKNSPWRVACNPTRSTEFRQSQDAYSQDSAIDCFVREAIKLAWDAEYIWASWENNKMSVSCYPPNKHRDQKILRMLKRQFSDVREHENLVWQRVLENTTEEN